MSQKEIMEQFAPKKCENQVEFDERMHAINHQQSVENLRISTVCVNWPRRRHS